MPDPKPNVFLKAGFFTSRGRRFISTPGEMELQEGEQIRVRPMPIDDVLQRIRDGRIHDGKTVASVLYYKRFCDTK